MPLQRSGSKAAFGANVAAEMNAGKLRDQNLAIAYSIKRRNRYMGGRLNRADGGETDYDPIIPPPADIGDPVREAVFPNTRSLMRGDPNPIRDLPSTPGKVPSPDYDPRYGGAAAETLPFALSGVAGLGSRGAGLAARGVGAAMPAIEETSLMSRGLQAVPRMLADKAPPSIAGLMATVGGSSLGEAQEQPGGIVVDPTPVEQKEIARIGTLIAAKKTQIERAMRTSSYRDPSKDPAVIALQSSLGGLSGDLAGVTGPNSPLGQRRAAALELQKSMLTKRGEADLSAAETKRHAELPYAEKYPGRQEWMQEHMPAVSGVTGLALGLLGKGKVLKPLAASTLAGGAEGGFTAAWPTLQDAEFLPAGSPAKRAAIDRLYDPEYWKENVVPGVATHAGIAGGSSLVGSKARQFAGQLGESAAKIRALTKTPEPPPPAPEIAAASIPRPKAPPKEYVLPEGVVLKKYDLGKRGTQWRQDGKVISAAKADELRGKAASGSGMPSTAVHEPSLKSPDQAPYYFSERGQPELALGHDVAGRSTGVGPRIEPAGVLDNLYARGASNAEINQALAAHRAERDTMRSGYEVNRLAARNNPFGDDPELRYAAGGNVHSPMSIAYAIRRQSRAEGGPVHAGPIMSAVPGRTDNHPMDVAEGSYVIPSETVSHLGENNTEAGMAVLSHMFGSIGGTSPEEGGEPPVPINAAGGEFVVPPSVVATIGGGDIKRGHEILDQWIMSSRKKHISTLRGLAGPAKS